LFGGINDTLLILQIHCSCCSSNKALGGRKNHLCSAAGKAGFHGWAGNSIPLP
jgi:hypothetical protein